MRIRACILRRVKADLATFFQALGDPTRLRLLNLMARGEACVCYFVEVLGEPQPKISRHLAYLRRNGIVSARREGKWMHYRINDPRDPAVARVLETTLAAFAEDKQMQRDRAAFERACCSTRLSGVLQYAPKPELARPRGE
ncbi:MAG TPA: metalloregulator ArsR/SmtB family transcription factor [Thermoanaerobaculia bacterium]|nr:metalloregulator ArsR/SmtB family transcription factor [Thermoanaerobaculia bacterium]